MSYNCNTDQLQKGAKLIPNKEGYIYWSFDETTLPEMGIKYKLYLAISKAFQYWQRILAPIIFMPTEKTSEAQIKIYFGKKEQFGEGVLAFATSPISSGSEICLNPIVDWIEFDLKKYDLEYVLAHEIGHALNAAHNNDINCLMHPTVNTGDKKVNISICAKELINNIYQKEKKRFAEIY